MRAVFVFGEDGNRFSILEAAMRHGRLRGELVSQRINRRAGELGSVTHEAGCIQQFVVKSLIASRSTHDARWPSTPGGVDEAIASEIATKTPL